MNNALPFRYFFRVRYAECDAQKVVFNANYGLYADVALVEFLRALGLRDQLIHGPYDCQLVKQTTEWKSPARYDDVLEASVETPHLGNTAFTVACTLRRAGESAVLARTETVYVLMDAATLSKTAIPEALRGCLQQGACGMFISHADSRVQAGSAEPFA